MRIEQMIVLPSTTASEILPWLLNLDYPWTSAAAIEAARSPEALAPVVKYLVRKEATR